jgi:GT2 family glycosyltransferase
MITASLVLYNTKEDDLRKVVACAHDSDIDRLFVIDNSSTDLLREKVTALSKKVVYIFGQGNVGYGKAHNVGLQKAIVLKSDYHIVLNPDIFFGSDVIRSIEHFMNEHLDIGLVLPNVVYPNGDLQYLCKLLPTPLDIFGRRLLSEKFIKKRNDRYEMREMGYDKIWNCPILSGCFMFLRISDIVKVGMFDERFFMYFEDFDLMRRLHKSCKTVFYPKVTIVHDHAAEHHTNSTLLKASIRSAIQYFNKWGWFFDDERRIENKYAFDDINLIEE